MSNVAKLKKKAAEYELKRQFDKALAIYIELLDNFDAYPLEVDVALFNRVGDMLLRQGNVADAVDYYERAVDKYAEGGFFNNAIALCNKILRQSPGRTSIYYKLGKISAQKGFKGDAKANFLEYADRMQKSGRIDEAFRALKEFADLCPDQDDIRLMLAEQLSRQSRSGEAIEQLQTLFDRYSTDGRDAEARATLDRIRAIDPAYEPRVTGQQVAQKSSELIFLDVYAPDPPRATPGASAAVSPPIPRIEDLDEPGRNVEPPPAGSQLGGLEPGSFEAPAEPDAGQLLDLEPTSFVTGAQDAVTPAGGMLEGLEATSFEPPAEAPARAADVGDIGDLQFLGTAGVIEDSSDPAPAVAEPDVVPPAEQPQSALADLDPPFLQDFEIPTAGGLTFADDVPAIQPGTEASVPEVRATDPGGVDEIPLMDLEIPGPPTKPVLRPTGDIPLISGLDRGADQDQAFADAWAAGSDDQAPAFSSGDADVAGFDGITESTPASGLDVILPPTEDGADRTRSATIAAEQSVERLEAESLAHPDDLLLRRQLGEARLEAGDREGGVADLEAVMAGLEREEDLAGASSLANEIARLMPDSVRIQQKRVEYAFRTNDRRTLVAAYLDLAAALLGDGQNEKARTVYKRVLDLAPDDIAAQAGLAALTPPEEADRSAAPAPQPRASTATPAAVRSEPSAPPTAAAPGFPQTPAATPSIARPGAPAAPAPAVPPKRGLTMPTPAQGMPGVAAQRDKVWTVPTSPVEEDSGSLVNLGDWFRDDDAPKSTRMVVEEKEPTGDEEADFAEMLRKFKQGVAENVDAEDHQAHYDLGVAFKEMGLVDEAIAEFQKALRAPSDRLPTYEALGQCFVDKGQFQVATAILTRALADHPAPDEQLIGLLYLLGVAAEALGRQQEAIDFYQRVFVIDIQFRDVADRLAALEQVGS